MTKTTKQLSTAVNQDPYEKLGEIYRQAIDQRLQNFSYADIAHQLERKEQTIRTWFMTGGIFYEAHEYRRNQLAIERQHRFTEVEEQLKDMAADAILVIKNRLRGGSEPAAFKVLEMVGYGAIQKIQDIAPEESEELTLLRTIVDKHERTRKPVPAQRKTN
jgi:hypothetical protein